MIDFGKIFCDLHPNELVTNYCCHEECNIGLCATCICSHTESHIQKRTSPDYQNIRTTYSNMQDLVRTRISALEHQKTRINELVENIRLKRKNITQVIIQARHETLEFVNRFYDAKEKQIMRKVEADQKKLGLHNQNRMDSLLNHISRDVNNLFAAAQELNSQNFLENFHRIRTQVLANSVQTQKQISQELDKNENYDVSVSINPTYINEIKAGLEKSLSLIWDDKQYVIKVTEPTNRSSRTNINNSSNNNNNQNSAVAVQKRMSESMPKPSFVNHQSRPQSNIPEQFASYVGKPVPQSRSSFQPTFRIQPDYQFKPQPQPQHQPYLINSSMPIQAKPNVNSRVELRMNSSEKNIKQNGGTKHPLAQSYMESPFNHLSTPQLQGSKKIRRSGLTVLRTVDNQKN